MSTTNEDQKPHEYLGMIDTKQTEALKNNNMVEAQRLLKLKKSVKEDSDKGVVVQSMEKAKINKDNDDLKKIIERLNAPKDKTRRELAKMEYYAGLNNDLDVGVQVKGEDKWNRVGVNVVDALDDIHIAFKTREMPDLSKSSSGLIGKITPQNVKDIRDFAKKALIPYVNAFFRAFELTDAKIHSIMSQSSNSDKYLDAPVLPVDPAEKVSVLLQTSTAIPAIHAIASSDPEGSLGMISKHVIDPMSVYVGSTGPTTLSVPAFMGGAKKRKSSKRKSSKKLSGGKKRKSSKRRSSGKRKLVGGADVLDIMAGGAKKRKSSKRRSAGKRKMTDDMVGGKKRKSSKRKSSKKLSGGKKRKSSKKSSKRRSGKKH